MTTATVKKASVRQLTDAQLRGARALVRVDFNVPLDDRGHVMDDTRMRAAVPTIEYLVQHGARVVLLSHLGRPKGRPEPQYSLGPVARHLRELIPQKVVFSDSVDFPTLIKASKALTDASPILLVENTRFFPGEEKNDDALAGEFAQLGDLFVNDAFGAAHRAHASTEGVARHLRPAVAGFLMERELDYLGRALSDPPRPFVAILGGAKISGKIDVIEALLPKVDGLLIGGAMASTFFRAMGLETGTSLVETDRIGMAKQLLDRAGARLTLPHDVVVAPSLDAPSHVVKRDAIAKNEAVYDIGPATAASFGRAINTAKTVLWNGPMGVFEKPPFDTGTIAVAEAMAKATDRGATTILGGGDSAAAVIQAGLDDRMTHVSTGGGASLEYLEGKVLPGVAALDDAA
ncbi:MAG TPA: phosphoglycerate kinase [Gemmatimonadaceae bacterium]|nr:phosphoglycerate kinase [Gemmatimonadaceae bacterium]